MRAERAGEKQVAKLAKLLFETTVKFNATVGFSSLSLRARTDFFRGSISNEQSVTYTRGSFELKNVTKALPLKYRFADDLTTIPTEDLADGSVAFCVISEQRDGVLGPDESRIFAFVFATNAGVFSKTVSVFNCSCPNETVASVKLNCVVDDNTLSIEHGSSISTPSDTNHAVIFQAAVLLQSNGDTMKSSSIAPLVSAPISIRSNRASTVVVQLYSDLPLTTVSTTELSNPSDYFVPRERFRKFGPQFIIEAGAVVDVCLQYRSGVDIPMIDVQKILTGSGSAKFSGALVLALAVEGDAEALELNQIGGVLKVVALHGVYCMPRIVLASPRAVLLGRLCVESDVRAEFELINESEAPLPLYVTRAPKTQVYSGDDVVDAGDVVWVSARSRLIIRCVSHLDSAQFGEIEEKYELNLAFLNALNVKDTVDVSVMCSVVKQLIKTVFPDHSKSSFDDTRGVVYVPPLKVGAAERETSGSASSVNIWFTMKNTYSQACAVSAAVNPVPALQEILKIKLMGRESKANIKSFILQPGESVNVRIVCVPLLSARLPQDMMQLLEPLPCLSDPDASILGSFVLESAPVSIVSSNEAIDARALLDSSDLKITTELRVAGTLLPGTTFTLSESTLLFQVEELVDSGDDVGNHGNMRLFAESKTLVVTNPSTSFPLDYVITANPSRHAGTLFHIRDRTTEAQGKADIVTDTLVPGVDKMSGTIAPGASETLSICLLPGSHSTRRNKALAAYAEQESPDAMQAVDSRTLEIIVEDASMPKSGAQKVQLRFVHVAPLSLPVLSAPGSSFTPTVDQIRPETPTSAPSSDPDRPQVSVALVELRGCTPVRALDARRFGAATKSHSRYEINVGQKTRHQQMNVEWEITLHNKSEVPLPYRLYVLHQEATSWLRIGRDCGVLKPWETHDIMLYLMRRQFGVFESYLMLENEANPADLKVIRISMEVVSEPISQGGDKLFEVLLAGTNVHSEQSTLPGQSAINFGNVYSESLENKRSFILHNVSQVPLDFQLSSTLGPSLYFSRSSVVLKRITEVTCEPKGYLQIYLFYTPKFPEDRQVHGALEVEESLHISCRLVKDFRRTIRLRARCHTPALKVHTPSSLQSAALGHELESSPNKPRLIFTTAGASKVEFGAQEISVSNESGERKRYDCAVVLNRFLIHPCSGAPLRCVLKNDSIFFDVSRVDVDVSDGARDIPLDIDVGASVTLRVSVKTDTITAEMEKLSSQEVPDIEEHISVNCLFSKLPM